MKWLGLKSHERCSPIAGKRLTLEDGHRTLEQAPVSRFSSLEKIGWTFILAMFAFILLVVFAS